MEVNVSILTLDSLNISTIRKKNPGCLGKTRNLKEAGINPVRNSCNNIYKANKYKQYIEAVMDVFQ